MSDMLHGFSLINLHEFTPVTDAYQWNAHDHFEQTLACFHGQNFLCLEDGENTTHSAGLCNYFETI